MDVQVSWNVQLVGERAGDRPEHHRGAEAGHEQEFDVLLGHAVALVESVHVWPLEPVSSCKVNDTILQQS